jgi:hypothetical protein
MFYFVIFHSSVSAGKDLDKKTLTTFLYGCVLYIIFHALLSTSERPFFKTIQSYFWVIMAIDIICMLYIYIKLLKPSGSGSDSGSFVGGLKEKVTGLLDNFIDTSMYTNDIELQSYPINMYPNAEQMTQMTQMAQRNPSGILKKSVSIDESMNEVKEIEALTNTDNLHYEETIPIQPSNDNGETDELNNQLLQLTDSMMQLNPEPTASMQQNIHRPTGDKARDLLSERAMTNLMQTKPKEVPAALQSTSIDAIRKRAKSTLASETVKTMTTKSVLDNRADLTNSQLGSLSLSYNPDELVSDVLKRPKFEKGTEPNGTASSRLTKETLQPSSTIWDNRQQTPNKKNTDGRDDAASVASSDVGSMLDFDMSEFAQSI